MHDNDGQPQASSSSGLKRKTVTTGFPHDYDLGVWRSQMQGPGVWLMDEAPARRRRVPDELRQRSEISCDRCKSRKRKCIKTNDSDTCVSCKEAGDECRISLPRKRRTGISEKGARFAVLESIVQATYPGESIESLDGLIELASRLGAALPPELQAEVGALDNDNQTGSQGEDEQEPLTLPEGWLVPAPRGGKHYVGPASLVSFARDARHLVAKSKILQQPAYDEDGMRRYLQASEFTEYKVSHSLEANLEGHPTTVVAANTAPRSISGATPEELGQPSGAGVGDPVDSVDDQSLSTRLINAYFDRVHPNFPVLHRGAFHVRHEQSSSLARIHDDPGWMCTVCMVYTLGAQAIESELPEAARIQEKYLSFVIPSGLGHIGLSSTLSNIQALLLLALYQHNSGERNTAWTLTGHAVRTAVAAGLHRDGENSKMDPFERNIRRTVWWTLHLLEQYLSLALGRPSFTDAIVSDARFPDALYEEGVGLPQGYLAHCVSLSSFIKKIKHAVALASISYLDESKIMGLLPRMISIRKALIAWKKGLPPSFASDQIFSSHVHRRLVINLLISADYLESILSRPYLLSRINAELGGRTPSAEICEIAEQAVSAAHASALKAIQLYDHGSLEGLVWLDFYAIQHAIMIISLHLLGQPADSKAESLREPVLRLLSIAQSVPLAPTFRLTMKVARQLAGIARIMSSAGTMPNSADPKGSDNPAAPPFSQAVMDSAFDFFQDGAQFAYPERSEADLFADFMSMDNDIVHPDLLNNAWNLFDLSGGILPPAQDSSSNLPDDYIRPT